MSRQHHILHIHLSKKKQKNLLDNIVAVAAFVYPMSGLPQVMLVFQGRTEGVSVGSWSMFVAFSLLFLIYGMIHRIKPMVVTNFLWILVDMFVVIGTLTHRMVG